MMNNHWLLATVAITLEDHAVLHIDELQECVF